MKRRSSLTTRPQDPTPTEAAFYARVAEDEARRTCALDHYIPPETGFAFRVRQAQVLRVTCCDGPQVGGFDAFSATDPSEHFWSSRTRILHGPHTRVGDRLWGTEPRMRPMFTFLKDTVEHEPLPFNARSHDLLYSRCSERVLELWTGLRGQPNCNSNFMRALEAIGSDSSFVHDPLNLFHGDWLRQQRSGMFFHDADARKGDHVELLAEIDTVVAISCCPSACNGDANKGLQVQVFDHPNRTG